MPYKNAEVRRKMQRENKRRKRRENPEHERAVRKLYYQRHAAKIAERNLAKRTGEREKAQARTAVKRAVTRGDLTPGVCEIGEDCFGRVEAHHDDYSLPLEVRWLCKSHHMRMHAGNL